MTPGGAYSLILPFLKYFGNCGNDHVSKTL
jgi:hypothetical protein